MKNEKNWKWTILFIYIENVKTKKIKLHFCHVIYFMTASVTFGDSGFLWSTNFL